MSGTSENLSKIATALVAAQREMGAALKDAANPYFKSKFADLNSIIEASVPVLNKYGIAVLQNPTLSTTTGAPVLQTMLLHESGEFLSNDTQIVVAKANDPQAYGSALSYARRYGLQATVTLRAEDDDAESAMTRPAKMTVSKTSDQNKIVESLEASVGKEVRPAKTISFNKKNIGGAANAGDI